MSSQLIFYPELITIPFRHGSILPAFRGLVSGFVN